MQPISSTQIYTAYINGLTRRDGLTYCNSWGLLILHFSNGQIIHTENQETAESAGRWWLTSIILATQELEIRKITA
jgi:hypothetical protein